MKINRTIILSSLILGFIFVTSTFAQTVSPSYYLITLRETTSTSAKINIKWTKSLGLTTTSTTVTFSCTKSRLNPIKYEASWTYPDKPITITPLVPDETCIVSVQADAEQGNSQYTQSFTFKTSGAAANSSTNNLPISGGSGGTGTGTGTGTGAGAGTVSSNLPISGSTLGPEINLNIKIKNPLKVDTVQKAIKLFMDAVLKIAIPFIVIFFIWSGLNFVLARGNPEKIKTAKNMFWYTIIGTLLILGAWTITNAIIGTVNSITG